MAFTFNTRYKPKTEREYTKTDLTVYDSAAGHPQEITIYGKSEVVDNDIHSVGEGWATVDLGTLTWNYSTTYTSFSASITGMATGSYSIAGNIMCARYQTKSQAVLDVESTGISVANNANVIIIKDPNYTDVATFKTAMNGIILAYELADPTQGNALSVKTDNGTGIGGTMATFTTGLPLYGIEGGARDSMWCDGTDGEVVKNCAEVDLGTLTWTHSGDSVFRTNDLQNEITKPSDWYINLDNRLCAIYHTDKSWGRAFSPPISDMYVCVGKNGEIGISNFAYTDAATFKTAMSGVKLAYELATPTTTPLTAAEIAQFNALDTYAGTTHYSTNDNPEIKIKYIIKIPTI